VVPASLLALVILAVCVIAAVSVIQSLTGHPPLVSLATLDRHLRTLHLDGTVMVTLGFVAAGLGLVLLGCAVIPGRAKTLALAGADTSTGAAAETSGRTAAETSGDATAEPTAGAAAGHGEAVAGVSRSGLRTALAATVADVDGVTATRVRVSARRVTLRVRTELTSTGALREAVSQVAEQRLTQAGLARPPAVRIGVRTIHRGAA
jgi:hypothetical protein